MKISTIFNVILITEAIVDIETNVIFNTSLKHAKIVSVQIKKFEFRHPKPCRDKEYCKFFKLDKCFYKHDVVATKKEDSEKEIVRKELKNVKMR